MNLFQIGSYESIKVCVYKRIMIIISILTTLIFVSLYSTYYYKINKRKRNLYEITISENVLDLSETIKKVHSQFRRFPVLIRSTY